MKPTEEEWSEHLATWRASGQSMPAYCEAHGLKVSAMRYWSGRQLKKERQGPPANFAKVRRRRGAKESASLCIVVGDAKVEVSPSFDAGTLRRTLEVLRTLGTGR